MHVVAKMGFYVKKMFCMLKKYKKVLFEAFESNFSDLNVAFSHSQTHHDLDERPCILVNIP